MTDNFAILEIETTDGESVLTYDAPTRKTSAYMTKYEYARLLATRALQISAGTERGRPRVDAEGLYDPSEIAKCEIHERVVPLVIRRTLPDGSVETWSVKDMHIRDY